MKWIVTILKLMITKYTIFLFFLIFSNQAAAQSYIPAKTVSDRSLVKKFFCEETIYPESSLDAGHEGTVKIKFIVDANSAVRNIRVTESVDANIDDEMIRVFKMLLWVPATKFGEPIASENAYAIKFNIRKYEKHCKQRGYDELIYRHLPVDTTYSIYDLKEVDKGPYPVFTEPGMNLQGFWSQHMEYPEEAFKNGITGTVTLGFVVEPHGRISNITIVRSVGGGCNEETIKLVKMLSWMPAIKDDMAVRSKMQFGLTFNLNNDPSHQITPSSQTNGF